MTDTDAGDRPTPAPRPSGEAPEPARRGAPDTPPANAANVAAGVIDRIRDRLGDVGKATTDAAVAGAKATATQARKAVAGTAKAASRAASR